MPADETCPVGQRYKLVDMQNGLFIVRVCHLSEFALTADLNNISFIPLIKE